MITRSVKSKILEKFFKGKALIILGARQTGKTTLMKDLRSSVNQESLWLDCDEPDVRSRLTFASATGY